MAMAHSVEGRFPFLDHRVVEFAARIPPRWKMKGLNEKNILKVAAGNLVPQAVLDRPKQPYRAPDAKSFFGDGGAREEYIEELLSESALRRTGVFKPKAVAKLVEKVNKDQTLSVKDNMALVGILSTQLVLEQFVENFSDEKWSCNASNGSADPGLHHR
jgi:asparagine synthase (glutamine-hydrolysing)